MNLLELIGFLLSLACVIFGSRELGRILAIPEAALVIPVIGLLVLLLRVSSKIPPRALLILGSLLAVGSFLSMGIAHALSLREPIFVTPVAAGVLFIAIQSRLFARWRAKTPNTGKGE